jgi:hypothetical protein
MDCDFALLAWEQGDVVVVEEDGRPSLPLRRRRRTRKARPEPVFSIVTWAAASWSASETVIDALTVAFGRSWRARKSAYSVNGV